MTRRPRRPVTLPPHRAPDRVLPLTVSQANRLRRVVASVLADLGVRAEVHADHASDEEGRFFGLWNLAVDCRMRPEREWSSIARTRFTSMVHAVMPEKLSDLELERGVHLRLARTDLLPDGWHPRARSVGRDVMTVLSVKHGDQVVTPPEEFWEERGGHARWLEIGRDNLVSVALAPDLAHRRARGAHGEYEVVESDRFFTSSTALVLDRLLARFTPDADVTDGALVSVPNRLQVAWRPLGASDLETSVERSVSDLASFAAVAWSSAPGPLSTDVFWVEGDRWVQLTGEGDARRSAS